MGCEEEESEERRRSIYFFDERYSNDIALSLMSIYECRKVKIGRGEGQETWTRAGIGVYIRYIYMYAEMPPYIYRFFFCAIYISLFSLDKKLKQKLFIPHVFFYKEVYLLIVIF